MMLQQIKPRNARSARALSKREPLTTENPKTTLFLRGTSTSSLLTTLITDLHTLKRPHAIKFTKKNPIHPFEDPSSLEFFSEKNDASLLVFANHSKKRPHSLTWVRCFGGKVLDLLELHVQSEGFVGLAQFKGEKCTVGVKPLLSFSGTAWDDPRAGNEYAVAKSMFIDFWRGGEGKEVDVEGLQLLISFFVGEEDPNSAAGVEGGEKKKPLIQMRCWRIVTKRCGQRVPRVEVEEMGPRVDFRIGRVREADQGLWKESLKSAKHSGGQAKVKKNVETDAVGDQIGRIHLGRQDLGQLQSRKMKGLKRGRDEVGGEEGDAEMVEDVVSGDDEVVDDGDEDDGDGDGGVEVKRQRLG